MTPLSEKISLRKIAAGDISQLLAIVDKSIDTVSRATGRMPQITSCYEAGRDGFWLHRVLEARGVTNHVIDAASMPVSRRARRAKTDRLDAEKMVRTLLALERGEPKVCSIVRVPSVAEEDAKRLHRERQFLMKERIQHIGRIKGLLATQGVRDFWAGRKDWVTQLESAVTGDGRPLPPLLTAEISRHCRRLALVDSMLREIDVQRDAMAAGSAEADQPIQRLLQLRGIGPQIATVLGREVFYRRFRNRRGLASYLGLTPSPLRSGNMERDQGISKAGNPRARTTSIELAWLWLRYQPQSALACWFRHRTGDLRGRIRRIAIVAVARKLMIALWCYLQEGIVPAGATLKA
jgi:transposase